MKLIVGLGNPGSKYKNTRHNIGYLVIDEIAKEKKVDLKLNTKLNGEIAEFKIENEKVFLLKPTTYMNLSGHAIIQVMSYYKIDIKDILVIFDDIHLPLGKIRLRELGGHGGHNGIKHIIETLGTQNFKRIKVGIDLNSNLPLDHYVLGNFNKEEKVEVEIAVNIVKEAALLFASHDEYKDVMTRFNTQT